MDRKINLHAAYSRLNEAISTLFDELGVPRSFTVPYVESQSTADHINAVGRAAAQNGGLTKNLISTAHHSGGRGWGTGDGSTVGHPVHKLKETIVPEDDANAARAISTARSFLNNIGHLLGQNDPTVKTAQAQLDLIAQHGAAGMTLYDLGVALQNSVSPPLKAVARKHESAKPGGSHPRGTPPIQSAPPAQPQSTPLLTAPALPAGQQ